MSSSPHPTRSHTITQRQAALIAGLGLLLMAILAPIANFGVLEKLFIRGDAQLTVQNVQATTGAFRLAGIGLLLVAILDLVVAWALYLVLRPVNPGVSLLAAWFRMVYAGIFALAVTNLFVLAQLLAEGGVPLEVISEQAMLLVSAFRSGWDLGLIIFGFHLLLVGYLVVRSGFFPWILGLLVMLSGLGYLVDGFGKLLSPDYSLTVSAVTFIGEVLFIFWLLWKGTKGFELATESTTVN